MNAPNNIIVINNLKKLNEDLVSFNVTIPYYCYYCYYYKV